MPMVGVRFNRGRKRFSQYAVVKKEMTTTHNQVIKPQFIRAFDDIVSNWTNRPAFAAKLMQNVDGLKLYVFPQGSEKAKQLWKWNVEGTKAHDIPVKNAPALAFTAGTYLPKTGPGGKWYGGPGSVVGGQFVRPLLVKHPGTEPRNWPTVVAKKNKAFYSRTVENAWKRAMRKIGTS